MYEFIKYRCQFLRSTINPLKGPLETLSLSAFPAYLKQTHDGYMPPNDLEYCKLLVFVVTSGVLCSTYLLITMTFERLYSVICPLKATSFNTVKRAKIIIACVFVSCFLYCIPYFFITDNRGNICIPNKFASTTLLGKLHFWFLSLYSLLLLCW